MIGEVLSAERDDSGDVLVTVCMPEGDPQTFRVAREQAHRYPVGREVEVMIRPTPRRKTEGK